MRRRNKEINIFSMSALDLFASAMGAFILITVIALPYYLKTDRALMEQAQNLQRENEQLSKNLEQLQAELNTCKATVEAQKDSIEDLNQKLSQSNQNQAKCEEQLKQVFIAVVMQWPEENIDIDLHVFTPNGDEYFFRKHNRTGSDYPSSTARLSRDTTRGPGVEVWEIPSAPPGKYQIYYDFYAQNGGSYQSNITGMIYTNKGSHSIPNVMLTYGQHKLVATITINSEGEISFD